MTDALGRPGEVLQLDGPALAAAGVLPAGLAPATAVVLRELAELAAAPWLAPQIGGSVLFDHLPGLRRPERLADPVCADLTVTLAAHADAVLWQGLDHAHLIIQVPGLMANPAPPRMEPGDIELAPRLSVRAPGGTAWRTLAVAGLSRHFWRGRPAPCRRAVNLLLSCGNRLVALPGDAELHLDN